MHDSTDRSGERQSAPAIASDARSDEGPFFRVLTASGRGAIAVIRVWGAGTIEAVGSVFRANAALPLEHSAPGRLFLGRIGAGLGDEVVAAVLNAPIPAVEIQCHGGTAAVAIVLEALERAACRPGQHWEIPGFDDHGGDSRSAEALEDLCLASTARTAEVLLDQVHGALLKGDRPPDQPDWPRRYRRAATSRLPHRPRRIGLRLLSGWKVVIAGRPNVGKSRLLNALCGFSRAIVDSTPGTTRDLIAFQTALAGWPVELADTAGLRATNHAIERLGIQLAQGELGTADLVLLVLDRSQQLRPIDRQLIAITANALVIANKSDLPPAWEDRDDGTETGSGARTAVTVSAERGDGMDSLVELITQQLVPVAPLPGEAVPFRRAHLDKLASARAELLAGHPARSIHELQTLMHGNRSA